MNPILEREYLQSLLQFRAVKISALNYATWEKWNEEAHKILQGASLFKCKDVAMEVYDIIVSAGVLPDQETFTLLIRASLINDDFVNAKLFMDEMTSAGYIPKQSDVEMVTNRHFLGAQTTTGWNKNAAVFVPTHAACIDMNGWETITSQKRAFGN